MRLLGVRGMAAAVAASNVALFTATMACEGAATDAMEAALSMATEEMEAWRLAVQLGCQLRRPGVIRHRPHVRSGAARCSRRYQLLRRAGTAKMRRT
eukprot:6205161-Pleurochrysis_carterae.AAC.1